MMTPLPSPLRASALLPLLRVHLAARERRTLGASAPEAVSSAVLIALHESNDDILMWFVKRPETMRKHRGQVAFPGGKRDLEDVDLWATALREAEEEIGLPNAVVDRIGVLDDLVTGTGFIITPHVAYIDASFAPSPNPEEVSRVFSAPLRTFTQHASGVFPKVGHTVEGELVWGATFAMARNLAEVVSSLFEHA
jgi:8-oxo-dGTP pyrophosphatase MutT (NUDIX family)